MNLNETHPSDATNKTLTAGVRLLSEGIGGALGFALTGSFGGLFGAMAGNTLPAIFEEVGSRLLGKRERERVGAVYILTEQAIQQHIEAGRPIRSDGFFASQPGEGRAGAEEVVEAMLTSAQREHEEFKLPYYANLLATIATNESFSRSRSNYFIKLAQSISMRQLAILAMLRTSESRAALRTTNYRDMASHMNPSVISVLCEVMELENRGLVGSEEYHLGLTDINPSQLIVEGDGLTLYLAMRLETMNIARKEEVKRLLS